MSKHMQINSFVFDIIDSNMYVIIDNDIAVIIDPNVNIQAKKLLDSAHVRDVFIILTHEHFDHISGVNYFRNYNTTVCSNLNCKMAVENHFREIIIQFVAMFIGVNAEQKNTLCTLTKNAKPIKIDRVLKDNDVLCTDRHKFYIKETPGHTKGSICIVMDEQCIFTGDSLLPDYQVETRLQGGNQRDYEKITLPFLENLSMDLIVYPGHGKKITLGKIMN